MKSTKVRTLRRPCVRINHTNTNNTARLTGMGIYAVNVIVVSCYINACQGLATLVVFQALWNSTLKHLSIYRNTLYSPEYFIGDCMHGNYSNVATLLYSSLKKDHWSVWVLYAKRCDFKISQGMCPPRLGCRQKNVIHELIQWTFLSNLVPVYYNHT